MSYLQNSKSWIEKFIIRYSRTIAGSIILISAGLTAFQTWFITGPYLVIPIYLTVNLIFGLAGCIIILNLIALYFISKFK